MYNNIDKEKHFILSPPLGHFLPNNRISLLAMAKKKKNWKHT
jgi:hypothetical protein